MSENDSIQELHAQITRLKESTFELDDSLNETLGRNDLLESEAALLREQVAGTFQRVLELEAENRELVSQVTEYRRLIETQNRLINEHTDIVAKNEKLEARVFQLGELNDAAASEFDDMQEQNEILEDRVKELVNDRNEWIESTTSARELARSYREKFLAEQFRYAHTIAALKAAGRELVAALDDEVALCECSPRTSKAQAVFEAFLATDHTVPDSSVAEHPPDKREVSGSIPDSATTDHQGER